MSSEMSVQKLSSLEAQQLTGYLPCYKGKVSPGRFECFTARQNRGVIPAGVSMININILPNISHQFAEICETCPVLLTAFAGFFAKLH
jgi:hypothetical protein